MRKAARPSGSMESLNPLLEGRAAPSPWWWCLLVVCVVVDGLVMSQDEVNALLFDPHRHAPHLLLLLVQLEELYYMHPLQFYITGT
jgi:hypothetical protein